MLAGCAFKRRLEPRKLLVAERLRGKHLGRNNAMLFIVTGDILRLAGGHFAERPPFAEQLHKIQQIRMNLPGKGAVQQCQTFGFRDGLILD